MRYGEHTALVEEVIDFPKGHSLLQGQHTDPSNWHVIHDLDEAKRFAWEAVIGPNEYSWTNVRELEMAEVRRRSYELEGFDEPKEALTAALELLMTVVRRKLNDELADLLDDIVADLHSCALNRAVNGPSGFFEEVFRAYRAGGWPCGWLGDYPAGQLVVYVPDGAAKPS